MAINRVATMDYAERYWDRPCDDGVIWLTYGAINVEQKRRELGAPASEGWEALFEKDGLGSEQAVFRNSRTGEGWLIHPWEGLADCAHFISKCLQAGGINVPVELDVGRLLSALQARSDTKTLAEKVGKNQAQKIINTKIFKKGDFIGYFNIDPTGDLGGAKIYTHSTLYAGDFQENGQTVAGVTCHTKSRFLNKNTSAENKWYLGDRYQYTLVHFSNDDPPPNRLDAEILSGWWKIEYGRSVEYYYIFKDGRARYTLRPPATNRELMTADGSAYWFQDGNKITFIWRKTGTLEEWTLGASARQASISVDNLHGKTAGKATKLF